MASNESVGSLKARTATALDATALADLMARAGRLGLAFGPLHTLLLARSLGWLHLLTDATTLVGYLVAAPCREDGTVVIRDMALLPPHAHHGALIDALAAFLRLPKNLGARYLLPGPACDDEVCTALRTMTLLAEYLEPSAP
jgi:hypothetical protein